MDSALPFNLDITNPDGNSFVTWILVTNDGRTQLDARPHGDALVLEVIDIIFLTFAYGVVRLG